MWKTGPPRQLPDVLASMLLKRKHFYKDQIEVQILQETFQPYNAQRVGRKHNQWPRRTNKLSVQQPHLLPA